MRLDASATQIIAACKDGDHAAVTRILARHPDLREFDVAGMGAIHHAATVGNIQSSRSSQAAGAVELESMDSKRRPLGYAAIKEVSRPSARCCVSGPISTRSMAWIHPCTRPRARACPSGALPCITWRGCRLPRCRRSFAAAWAAYYGHSGTVMYLLRAGADINRADGIGCTASLGVRKGSGMLRLAFVSLLQLLTSFVLFLFCLFG